MAGRWAVISARHSCWDSSLAARKAMWWTEPAPERPKLACGVDEDVDMVAEGGGVGGAGEAEAIAFCGDLLEAHEGEGGGGFGGVELEHGDAVEAADGVGGGDVREARGMRGWDHRGLRRGLRVRAACRRGRRG